MRRRHRLHVRLAGSTGRAEHFRGDGAAGRLEAPARRLYAQRQGDEGHDAEGEKALDLDVVVAVDGAHEREARILQSTGGDEVAFGNAQFGVGGLQAGVVVEGDLHRVVGTELACEQGLDAGFDGIGVGLASYPGGVAAQACLRGLLRERKTAVGREVRAAAKEYGQ